MTDNAPNRQGRLVVRIGKSTLSFSTRTAEGVEYAPYPLNSSISMAANLREALRERSDEHRPQRVLVLVDSPVMMVPVSLFDEALRDEQYRHTFTAVDQQTVMHAVLPDLNCVAVFAVHKDLCTVLRDAFADVQYMPAIAPVWKHLHQRSYTGQHQKMYGYFHERRMEVFSFAQNRFKFCNSYAVNNPNDALYYLLAVWQQLGMAPEHDELHMVGDIPEREALMDEAKKFVKRVFYINPSGEFNRAPVAQIQDMPYDLMVLFVKGI